MSSKTFGRFAVVLLAATLLFGPVQVQAVINAGLQPSDLYRRFNNVATAVIQSIDTDQGSLRLQIDMSFKGDLETGSGLSLQAQGAMKGLLRDLVRDAAIAEGQHVALFAGKKLRGKQDELLFYAGGFQMGTMQEEGPWVWSETDKNLVGEDGETVPTMMGTWNGDIEKLSEMLEDISQDRSFFPRRAYAQFKEDALLDEFEAPVRNVALYDIDGDGDLDIYATSEAGDQLYYQMQPLVFAPAAQHVGLQGVSSSSVSFADVDLDGFTDLLTGGVIRRGEAMKPIVRFSETDWLPATADEDVKSSAFVELNNDGYPDVIISREGGGLCAYLNPAEAGGAFADATEECGLAGFTAGKSGFFAPGDWNGDGKTDLFYAVEPGILLVKSDAGRFESVDHSIRFRFASGQDGVQGLTGAGAFTPITDEDDFDLIVPIESSWFVVENRGGEPVDVTQYGNEISEGSYLHLATLAEDLNLDGYSDFYTTSRQENGHNRYIINRGYGSFMLASTHKVGEHMFNGPASEMGGWGIATGDIDGDGTPDLLFGNSRGMLFYQLNDSLSLRQPTANPTDDVATLLESKVLTVNVRGPKGVVGALVTLSDSAGNTVLRRQIGTNVNTGSRSADSAFLAVREPGPYTLAVTYSDGHTEESSVDLTKQTVTQLTVSRQGGT